MIRRVSAVSLVTLLVTHFGPLEAFGALFRITAGEQL